MNSALPAAAEPAALPPPPRADTATLALFVDIDGTLLDIAARPDAVIVEPALRATLAALHELLRGALAPLSGRSLRSVDALLALPSVAAAGLHGAELRANGGDSLASQRLNPELDMARARANETASTHPGVIVEDTGAAIALHYRSAPTAEIAVRRAAIDMLDSAGSEYELLQGNLVIELKPAHADKGSALATLMQSLPFVGRTPWMIGDDLTDEDAFAEANALGGVSIIVGPRRPTLARYALPDPGAARAWLADLLEPGEPTVFQ
ncbi:MAG TPA: trehalose-phosphatase [Rhodanobacteraceae bacterium]|jgi:trehalose 6-phosphate phosphatase|nr:trehalose-phosphatase [Rhodanobacteraceae bacterium]